MTKSAITIIIPIHNGECYLAAAVCSVLAQTLSAAEVLVVDDDSTDSNAAIEWRAHAVQLKLHHVVLHELVLCRRLHRDNLTRREPAPGHSDYPRLLCAKLARSCGAATEPNDAPSDTPR